MENTEEKKWEKKYIASSKKISEEFCQISEEDMKKTWG